jgi:hypothetical protein
MSGCAVGGLIYSPSVRVPLIKRCVLRHGAKVQSSTVLVHWLWLEAAKRPSAYSSVYCTAAMGDELFIDPQASLRQAILYCSYDGGLERCRAGAEAAVCMS